MYGSYIVRMMMFIEFENFPFKIFELRKYNQSFKLYLGQIYIYIYILVIKINPCFII